MPLSEEQIKEIKKQLLEQIESFPEEQREAAKEQIESMNAEQLEQFLVKNKLMKSGAKKEGKQECVFCLISQNKLEAYKIAENKDNLAVLEINPVSKGHSIIVPKKHLDIEKIPSSSFSLAKKIAKKIKSKLKAEKIQIESSDIQGHAIINVIPIYKDMPKERKKAEKEELKEVQEKLKIEKRQRVKKPKLEKQPEKAPRRIP